LPRFDQAGSVEHCEMLRDCLLGNVDLGSYLTHRTRAFPEQLQNLDATRLTERFEHHRRFLRSTFHEIADHSTPSACFTSEAKRPSSVDVSLRFMTRVSRSHPTRPNLTWYSSDCVIRVRVPAGST